MNANDLRRRAAELLSQAEEALAAVATGEDAPADLAQRHDDLAAQAEAAIDQAERLEAMEARRAALAARANAAPAAQAHTDSRNTRGGRHQYSATRAISAQARGMQPDGLEGEVASDLARERSVSTKGVMIPFDAEISYRAHSSAGAIGQLVRGPIRDALLAQLVLAQAGVETIISPTVFKLPLANTGATYWVTNAAPTEADRNVGSAVFTAHTLAGSTTAGRQDLVTASEGVVDYLWRQLLADLAVGLQAGCLHGTNSGGQPKGVFAYTYSGAGDIDVRPGATNGKALDYPEVLAMAGKVAAANARGGAFITNPNVFSKLEATPRVSGQAIFTADAASGTIAGRPAFVTSSVRGDLTKGSGTALSAAAFGDWSQSVLGVFSGIDVLINPYLDSGGVKVSAFADVDFQLLRPSAFSIATDVITV